MHPSTAQGYTSLGDTASGMIPSMALGGYTVSDDIAPDRFWTSNVGESCDVGSISDLSMSDFDTRSEYDHYFAETGTRRDSAVASAGTQVGHSPWTLATPGSTQGVPRSTSDPSLVPPQFRKRRTPPPRTVVATTRTEMYVRHTSQDVTVTSPTPGLRCRHASSSSTSSGSCIPGPPQTSLRSSVQQWLDALDTQVPLPPTPVMPVS